MVKFIRDVTTCLLKEVDLKLWWTDRVRLCSPRMWFVYMHIAQVAMDLAMAVVNKPHSRAAPAFKLLLTLASVQMCFTVIATKDQSGGHSYCYFMS